jgi:hypothetical protein
MTPSTTYDVEIACAQLGSYNMCVLNIIFQFPSDFARPAKVLVTWIEINLSPSIVKNI